MRQGHARPGHRVPVRLRLTAAATAVLAGVLLAGPVEGTALATRTSGEARPHRSSLPDGESLVQGRVQRCRWSYTKLSGTRCRSSATYPPAQLLVTAYNNTVLDVAVRDVDTGEWRTGPYRYRAATQTAMLDGSRVTTRPPRVGVAYRSWMDRCTYWTYSPVTKKTGCQQGRTMRVTVKRTASNGARVRQPDGTYQSMPAYTWRPRGKGYYALDASRLSPPRAHPIPPPPPLAAVPPGPSRSGSPTSYRVYEGIKATGSYCNTREITVRVDYTGATRAGYSIDAARAAVTYAMNEAAAASGYPMVMGAPIAAPAATFDPLQLALDNELVVTFDTARDPAYDNARVGYVPGQLYSSTGVAGPQYSSRTGFYGWAILSADFMSVSSVEVARALAMHEFGHTFGLDHVNDVEQMMYPVRQDTDVPLARYGAGDAAGFAFLRARSGGFC